MSCEDLVLVERHGAISTIAFNEPERMNPLSSRMRLKFHAAIEAAMWDPSCRVLVLTGAGGQFCAGADVREMTGGDDPQHARRRLGSLQAVIRLIYGGPKPVVAAVEGVAFGAGLSLVAASDFVIASQTARFGAAFGRIGLAADCGLLLTLPLRIGIARAKDMLFTGKPVTGAQAHALGLVDELVAPGGALEAALEKAEDYLETAPLTIAAAKTAFEEGPLNLDHALRLEQHQQSMMRMTADHAEGRSAFLERREPSFTGR